jgi:hypothetical protein
MPLWWKLTIQQSQVILKQDRTLDITWRQQASSSEVTYALFCSEFASFYLPHSTRGPLSKDKDILYRSHGRDGQNLLSALEIVRIE